MRSSNAVARIAISSASSCRPRMVSSSPIPAPPPAISMKQMEADLGTELDWIAVDHPQHRPSPHPHHRPGCHRRRQDPQHRRRLHRLWDPGAGERGGDPGARPPDRAGGVPQPGAGGRCRSLHPARPHADRRAASRNEFADLRPDRDTLEQPAAEPGAADPSGRASCERMGLAIEVEPGRWSVSPRAEPVLRELGERGDIIKTMHRALDREGWPMPGLSRAMSFTRRRCQSRSSAQCARQGAGRRRDG